MATTFVVASLFVILVGGELQPHRTVVDLRRMNATFGKHTIDPNKPNITIGFLSSFKELGKLICGAISLAVEMVNADSGLLPKHNLKFIAYDSGEPNTAITIKKMTQMKEEGVVAFIGPDHSCVSEALVAAAWNMPMITYVSTYQKFYAFLEQHLQFSHGVERKIVKQDSSSRVNIQWWNGERRALEPPEKSGFGPPEPCPP
ncbi:guanylate cyclase 32E [Trichonephila clavipes]|nr:guanylate cyclase 32E [Trichonephila clavipes]